MRPVLFCFGEKKVISKRRVIIMLKKIKKSSKKMVSMRLDLDILNRIRDISVKENIPYQTLIKSWLLEKVNETETC